MRRITLTTVAIAAAVLVSCTAQQSVSPALPSPAAGLAEGTITHISSGHGNAYTSIGPDEYEPLGLKPGMRIHVAIGETDLILPVGRTYTDVPKGTPLAVLHPEGLTFAICHGNFSAAYDVTVGTPFVIAAVDEEAH